MKFNISLNNLFNFRRFAGRKFSISDLINYSTVFLLVLTVALFFFDLYVFYLYFYGFNFAQNEKAVVSFSAADYKKAVEIINEREKKFNDIAAENKAGPSNPFR